LLPAAPLRGGRFAFWGDELRVDRSGEKRRGVGGGVAKPGPMLLLNAMETAPDDQAQARRTVRILYLCMAVGIVLPFVLFWFLR